MTQWLDVSSNGQCFWIEVPEKRGWEGEGTNGVELPIRNPGCEYTNDSSRNDVCSVVSIVHRSRDGDQRGAGQRSEEKP